MEPGRAGGSPIKGVQKTELRDGLSVDVLWRADKSIMTLSFKRSSPPAMQGGVLQYIYRCMRIQIRIIIIDAVAGAGPHVWFKKQPPVMDPMGGSHTQQ